MEKVCEFCTTLRPLVYCKADAAYLCLPCDAKVHLANALSSRHLRTLLCNLCRYHFAYVQCLDRQILICRGCDQNLPDVSFQHHRRAIRSYMGCPSAKDFASLWGFSLNEIENNAHEDKFASISCGSADLNMVNVSGQSLHQIKGPSMVSRAKFKGVSSGQQGQILDKDKEQQTIVQQIIDLKRLQLSEEFDRSLKINGLQETDLSSTHHTQEKFDEKFDQHATNSQNLATDLLDKNSPTVLLKPESLSSTFSQLDNLTLSPINDLPMAGEFFWTCNSPAQSNQLWSHNIQDLGICEELNCQDDFNIPDVDLTFQNFEELFGDKDPIRGLLSDKDVSFSSIVKDMPLDNSDIDNASTTEDSLAAASIVLSQTAHVGQDSRPSNQYHPRSTDPTHEISPSDSTRSFSVTRFSAESSHADHYESVLSAYSEGKGNSLNPLELEVAHTEVRRNATAKHKEKKSQMHDKQVRLSSGKPGGNVRKRLKGQVTKAESY